MSFFGSGKRVRILERAGGACALQNPHLWRTTVFQHPEADWRFIVRDRTGKPIVNLICFSMRFNNLIKNLLQLF